MIDELGGWDAFQGLLQMVHQIALKHDSSITNVAVRYILEHDQVAAAIIGVRNMKHIEETLRLFKLNLDTEDRKKIDEAIAQRSNHPGGVYELERQGSKHAAIMQYNLNSARD